MEVFPHVRKVIRFSGLMDFQLRGPRASPVQQLLADLPASVGNRAPFDESFASLCSLIETMVRRQELLAEAQSTVADEVEGSIYATRSTNTTLSQSPFSILMPAQIDQIDRPQRYRLKQATNLATIVTPGDTDGTTHIRLVQKKTHERFHASFVAFKLDDALPDHFHLPKHARNGHQPPSEEALERLRALFQQRPIWLRLHLLASMTEGDRLMYRQLLPHVAFCFTSGPWKTCWVRYGYDPRIDASSRFYQLVITRRFHDGEEGGQTYSHLSLVDRELAREKMQLLQQLREQPRSSLAGKGGSGDANDAISLFTFNEQTKPAETRAVYQMADIEHAALQPLVHTMDANLLQSSCNVSV